MRLFGARGSAELREVASGFGVQSLWLRNRKVRSHLVVRRSKKKQQNQQRIDG